MTKTIVVLVTAILFSCVSLAGAVSSDMLVTEHSIEPNQLTYEKCFAGTIYLQSVCFLSDGDFNKCISQIFLYGVPCMIFDGIMGDDEISLEKCLVGYFYILIACLASDGNVLKCLALAASTYYLPCTYCAINNDNDSDSNPNCNSIF